MVYGYITYFEKKKTSSACGSGLDITPDSSLAITLSMPGECFQAFATEIRVMGSWCLAKLVLVYTLW